jgi:hypothetical protein
VLHREEFHRFAPHIGVFHTFTPITCPATRQSFHLQLHPNDGTLSFLTHFDGCSISMQSCNARAANVAQCAGVSRNSFRCLVIQEAVRQVYYTGN